MANWAAEIRIRAERKLGGMLKAQKDAGGMRDGGTAMKAKAQSHDETELPLKLAALGISKSMSSRAQAICHHPRY